MPATAQRIHPSKIHFPRFLASGVYKVEIYHLDGEWFADDIPNQMLLEPLVRGIPDVIHYLGGKRCDHFFCVFSAHRFPEAQATLRRTFEGDGGCWYELVGESNVRGWLCPMLLRYFREFPEAIHFTWFEL